jgi:hypothetical protein
MLAGGAAPQHRIEYAFRRAAARRPDEQERKLLMDAFQDALHRFRAAPESAKKLLDVGESKADPSLDAAELAAYTVTASIILNLDETITKE